MVAWSQSHRKLIWSAFFCCNKMQPHCGNIFILLQKHIACPKGKGISHHYMSPESVKYNHIIIALTNK